MSNTEDYELELNDIQAISTEEVKTPFIPIEVYTQEAENLYHWSKNDQAQLQGAGLPEYMIQALATRSGACREAQSLWMQEKIIREEAHQIWKLESPAAYELRDTILHSFRYAYRNNEKLLQMVSDIAEGDGHADMIQDLNDLAILGKKHTNELAAIKFDLTLLDQAASMADRMAELLAQANGVKKEGNQVKLIRDKAYTHLKKAVDEVRACGKYVFWKNEDRLKGYRSNYIHRKNRRLLTQKSNVEQEN